MFGIAPLPSTLWRMALVALVAMQDRARGHLLEEQISGGAIGDLAARQKESDRTVLSIGQGVDLRGPPAARSTDRLILLPLCRLKRSDAPSPRRSEHLRRWSASRSKSMEDIRPYALGRPS